jgi:hypothetical protein
MPLSRWKTCLAYNSTSFPWLKYITGLLTNPGRASFIASNLHLLSSRVTWIMFVPHPLLSLTLLAGPNRVLRELVLEQLIAQAQADRRHLMVLSCDRQRQPLSVDHTTFFRSTDTGQLQLAQAGAILPSRADLLAELDTIMRLGSAEEVVVELSSNAELLHAREALLRRSSGGIHFRNIGRLARSIIMIEADLLPEALDPSEAASELNVIEDPDSVTLAKSLKASDTVVITDSMTIDPERLGRAIRLLRGVNPALAIVDTRLFRFDSIPVPGSV